MGINIWEQEKDYSASGELDCLDWGFDPITAITGAPLMESMEQIGRAAAWCVAFPS